LENNSVQHFPLFDIRAFSMHAVRVRIGHALARQAARLSTAVTEHARPPPSAAHLTARLGRATNVGAALGLVREHVGRADDILLAAMWSQLRKLVGLRARRTAPGALGWRGHQLRARDDPDYARYISLAHPSPHLARRIAYL
jgi:hypothetical protein